MDVFGAEQGQGVTGAPLARPELHHGSSRGAGPQTLRFSGFRVARVSRGRGPWGPGMRLGKGRQLVPVNSSAQACPWPWPWPEPGVVQTWAVPLLGRMPWPGGGVGWPGGGVGWPAVALAGPGAAVTTITLGSRSGGWHWGCHRQISCLCVFATPFYKGKHNLKYDYLVL